MHALATGRTPLSKVVPYTDAGPPAGQSKSAGEYGPAGPHPGRRWLRTCYRINQKWRRTGFCSADKRLFTTRGGKYVCNYLIYCAESIALLISAAGMEATYAQL